MTYYAQGYLLDAVDTEVKDTFCPSDALLRVKKGQVTKLLGFGKVLA